MCSETARAEVANVIEGIVMDIDRAQRQARQELEAEIRKATALQLNTLHELIGVARVQIEEVKKLRR